MSKNGHLGKGQPHLSPDPVQHPRVRTSMPLLVIRPPSQSGLRNWCLRPDTGPWGRGQPVCPPLREPGTRQEIGEVMEDEGKNGRHGSSLQKDLQSPDTDASPSLQAC